MRRSAIHLIALCLPVLVASSGGGTESAPSGAQPSAADAYRSEVDDRQDENSGALVGTWDYEFDRAERRVILKNFAGLVEHADRVVVRLAFVDEDDWWLGFLFDGDLFLLHGVPEGDNGTYTVSGNRIATIGSHGEVLVTYGWELQGRKLTLTALEECEVLAGDKVDCIRDRADMDPLMRLATEHTYTRSGNDVTY